MSVEREGRDEAVDEGVRAFRAVTALATDGRATRSRVLAAAGRRPPSARHVGLGAVAAIVIVLSGAAAWTAVGRWRAGAAANEVEPAAALAPRKALAEPQRAVAAPASVDLAPVTTATMDAGDEERLYGRAHEAHFGGHDPGAALAGWNQYLRRYPHGAFAPEARYNRALALLRLGRIDAAVTALRPFASGAFGAYRRGEANALIAAVATRGEGDVPRVK